MHVFARSVPKKINVWYILNKFPSQKLKNVKTQFSWKNSSSFSKKLKLFGSQTQRTGSESLHPATIKVVKKKPELSVKISPSFTKNLLIHSHFPFFSLLFRAKSCTKLSEYYVIHINTLISYFRIGDAKLRMNAVHFLTFLLAENSRLVVESDLVNPERICSEFSKLLANDPSDEVLLHSTLDIWGSQ